MLNILVVGETCLDKFIYCDVKRLSPEAPVPVLEPVEIITNPGMSGNVVRNIEAMERTGTANITHYRQHREIIKTRYVEKKSNHMFIRFDEGEMPITYKAEHRGYKSDFFNFEDVKDKQFDIVIVSDYDKGYLSDRDIARLGNLGEISMLDSKRRLTHAMIDNYTWVKLNKKEAENNRDLTYYSNMLITMGAEGVQYANQIIPSPRPQETIDVSGAGDTFTAAFALRYYETRDAHESIDFANLMAANVVSKRGVATP